MEKRCKWAERVGQGIKLLFWLANGVSMKKIKIERAVEPRILMASPRKSDATTKESWLYCWGICGRGGVQGKGYWGGCCRVVLAI
jgi:hypothetical protein